MTIPVQAKTASMLNTGNRQRVAWLGNSLDMNIASIRYRLIYPAAMLEKKGWTCEIFDSPKELSKSITNFDALIIVKRLDPSIIQLISDANDQQIPIVLDFCDDVLDQDYRAKSHEMFRMVFDAVSTRISAIVTTGEYLKRRFEKYGFSGPIMVIPDCIENEKVRALASSFVASKLKLNAETRRNTLPLESSKAFAKRLYKVVRYPRRTLLNVRKAIHEVRFGAPIDRASNYKALRSDPDLIAALETKGKIAVWFGNHGGPHSDFGLLTLLRITEELRSAHQATPFTLVVLSNHREKWEDLIRPIGIPTRYVDWSSEGTNELLRRAHAFIMPTGEDSFSLGKSANRVLLALEHRTPVIAGPLESLDWLKSNQDGVSIEKALISVLSDRAGARETAIAQRSNAYELFNLGNLTNLWSETLNRISVHKKRRDLYGVSSTEEKLLVCINNPTDQATALAVLDEAKRRGVEVGVVVSPQACLRNPRLAEDLGSRRISPTYLQRTDTKREDYRWLRNATMLFCPSESSHPAHQVSHWLTKLANKAGVRTFTAQHGLRNIGLTDPLDRHHSIASSTIFTWNAPGNLPDWVPDDVRRRCVHIGRIVQSASNNFSGDSFDSEKLVGVYENLHWKLYDDEYRRRFIRSVSDAATDFPDIEFVVVPHPAGLWSVKHLRVNELPDNIIVLNPLKPPMKYCPGTELLPHFKKVLTTPSTIAVDSAQAGVAVGVLVPDAIGYTDFSPLPLLTSSEDVADFLSSNQTAQSAQLKKFVSSVVVDHGSPVENALEAMLGLSASETARAILKANIV